VLEETKKPAILAKGYRCTRIHGLDGIIGSRNLVSRNNNDFHGPEEVEAEPSKVRTNLTLARYGPRRPKEEVTPCQIGKAS
jgi:hypothetical protein